MMATRHDIARQWLLALITEAAQLGQIAAWGRANWALARMESLLENNAEAAFYYMEVAAHPDTPPRFKIQAMLRGLKFLGKSGDTSTDIDQLTDNIRAILRETDDFRILLDAARQLALAGSNFTALKNEAADHGARLADKAIAAATTPQEQLAHLEYLTCKLYWDLSRTRELLQRWDNLTERQKADFHSTGSSVWYEYLSVIFLSLTESERAIEATALASGFIDTNNATPEGYVILGSIYAEWLIQNGKKDKALEFFEWIVKESPTYRKTAIAHYWIALRSLGICESSTLHHCEAGIQTLKGKPESDKEILLTKSLLKVSEKFSHISSLAVSGNELDNIYEEAVNIKLAKDCQILQK